MTNAIDNAVARVQDIVAAMTSVKFKSYPDYPIENADPFPMSIAYLGGGEFVATNGTDTYFYPAIHVEMHFSRISLKNTYPLIYAAALEFSQRLAGDPTLNGNVTTIIATQDQPLAFTVRPFDWGSVISQMMLFVIPIKVKTTPTTTP